MKALWEIDIIEGIIRFKRSAKTSENFENRGCETEWLKISNCEEQFLFLNQSNKILL